MRADAELVMSKPTYVKAAGWLLVIPATLAWLLPLSILRDYPLQAGLVMAIVVAVFYGMFAVNLNWPLAWVTAGWGSLVLALVAVAMVPVTNGKSLIIVPAALPIAVLLLGPAQSRAWFRS